MRQRSEQLEVGRRRVHRGVLFCSWAAKERLFQSAAVHGDAAAASADPLA